MTLKNYNLIPLSEINAGDEAITFDAAGGRVKMVVHGVDHLPHDDSRIDVVAFEQEDGSISYMIYPFMRDIFKEVEDEDEGEQAPPVEKQVLITYENFKSAMKSSKLAGKIPAVFRKLRDDRVVVFLNADGDEEILLPDCVYSFSLSYLEMKCVKRLSKSYGKSDIQFHSNRYGNLVVGVANETDYEWRMGDLVK